tara:strand:+ start:19 stop:846 length:828 start_codon:yes stop_codon:yes gene_type:complete
VLHFTCEKAKVNEASLKTTLIEPAINGPLPEQVVLMQPDVKPMPPLNDKEAQGCDVQIPTQILANDIKSAHSKMLEQLVLKQPEVKPMPPLNDKEAQVCDVQMSTQALANDIQSVYSKVLEQVMEAHSLLQNNVPQKMSDDLLEAIDTFQMKQVENIDVLKIELINLKDASQSICHAWMDASHNPQMGNLGERAHYLAAYCARAFLRVFDVLSTLLVSGKLEASTYNSDKAGEMSYIKLPTFSKHESVRTFFNTISNIDSDEPSSIPENNTAIQF